MRAGRGHFVGIGGIGMSAIARILLQLDCDISGSDNRLSPLTEELVALGASIEEGHSAERVEGASYLVVSSAIDGSNPEVKRAQELNLPIIARGEMLAELMKSRRGVAIGGTHGKTTISSMTSVIFERAQLDPSILVGGIICELGTNSKLGSGDYLIAEADESDASFLQLDPEVSVVTSMDSDINFSSPAFAQLGFDELESGRHVISMFVDFLKQTKGVRLVCWDDTLVRQVVTKEGLETLKYGFHEESDFRAENVVLQGFTSRFDVYRRAELLGTVILNMPGRHNIQNALAAIAVAYTQNIDFSIIQYALEHFQGVRRRFERVGEVKGAIIVEDYAHNPPKVRAALHAASVTNPNRVIAVFQPHRYTRTKFLVDEFGSAFAESDILVVTDVYSAGEKPIVGAESSDVIARVKDYGLPVDVFSCPEEKDVEDFLTENIEEGDVVVMLGAGSVGQWAQNYVRNASSQAITS